MTNQFTKWILGARPKTLGAAFAPVIVGSALGYYDGNFEWVNAILAIVVGLSLQVGVNYANDYSDGIKGSDTQRVGPIRLVASGLATATAVKRAALLNFVVAGLAGTFLAIRVNLWLIVIGAICIAAAWYYTGGKTPYGYRGLGEISVFIFFGLIATVGSYFVQSEQISLPAVISGISIGFISTALLVVNNLRDLPLDQNSKKITLAVRIGDSRTRLLYLTLVIAGIITAMLLAFMAPIAALSGLLVLVAMQPIRDVVAGAKGKDLIPTLQQTNKLLILLGLILTISFLFA